MAKTENGLKNVSKCTITDEYGRNFIVSTCMDGGIIIEADHLMNLREEWLQEDKKLLVETTNYVD